MKLHGEAAHRALPEPDLVAGQPLQPPGGIAQAKVAKCLLRPEIEMEDGVPVAPKLLGFADRLCLSFLPRLVS
jgi:hypothetical protein